VVHADWDVGDPYKMHYPQLPDLSPTGMDVVASISFDGSFPIDKWLADDWRCTASGPVTDIHIWGSWLDDFVPQSPIPGTHGSFQLAIYDDIPAGPSGEFSRPGNLLWSRNFGPGTYTGRLYGLAPEQFYDPNLNEIIGTDTQVWQYNFDIDPSEAFHQENGKIYWLAVHNIDPTGDGYIDIQDALQRFGWKTSLDHFNDDAVFTDNGSSIGLPVPPYPPPPVDEWTDMHYPPGHPFAGQSIDLAFVITGIPEPASLLLMITAVPLLGMGRRRRHT
jgi:hypothetical protein